MMEELILNNILETLRGDPKRDGAPDRAAAAHRAEHKRLTPAPAGGRNRKREPRKEAPASFQPCAAISRSRSYSAASFPQYR